MKSTVRQLEDALMSALDGEAGGRALVRGFRESVAEGAVKLSDSDGRPEILVQVSPASSQSYGSPVVEFSCAVQVQVRWSDDPTIATFDEIAALAERLLHRWNARGVIEDMSAALTTENFRADGFRLDGGTDTAEVSASGEPTISTTFNFAVKGVYTETANEE